MSSNHYVNVTDDLAYELVLDPTAMFTEIGMRFCTQVNIEEVQVKVSKRNAGDAIDASALFWTIHWPETPDFLHVT